MHSTQLKGYLTGLVLGDGYIDKGVSKRAFRIKSINRDFIEQIRDDLAFTNFKISIKDFPGSLKGGVRRNPYSELRIGSNQYFRKMYHHFYDDYRERRIVTKSLLDLNPQGLANWYMSDGYIVKVGKTKGKIVDRRVELCLDRYSSEDVDKVLNYFTSVHGYKVKKVRRREGVFRMRISLLDAQDFLLLISPYVVPTMEYKLNMEYETRPKWMRDEYFQLMTDLQRKAPR